MLCNTCNNHMQPDWCYCPHCGAKESTRDNTPQPARSSIPANCRGFYVGGVRTQVFQVVVNQAMAGVPWRLLWTDHMKLNNITEEMVEEELERRKTSGAPSSLSLPPEPPLPSGDIETNADGTLPSKIIENVAYMLEVLENDPPSIFVQRQKLMIHLAYALRLANTPIKEKEAKLETR